MENNTAYKNGLGIVAFDDTIHLKNIAAELRDLCDVIIICLQKHSYYGIPINDNIVNDCESLVKEGFVDDIVWFKENCDIKEREQELEDAVVAAEERMNGLVASQAPTEEIEASKKDLAAAMQARKEFPRLIETDKRNFILDCLKERGCTHAHVIDSDEFYDHDDYAKAKETIYGNPALKVTYCEYINYYRDYCHLMVWPYRCYVPFISEIEYRFDFKNGSFDKPSDPTRRYKIDEENGKYCIFNFKTVKMHHLSWIRTNIEDKIDNWSSKKYFENYEGLKERIIERYNNYKDGQNAVIMFATPNFEVVVNKLPTQYIHPKYPLI